MTIMKKAPLLIALVLLSGCNGKDPVQCKLESSCVNDKSCQCWCSVECGWRDKTPADNPIWIENDPNGKHCYCKQWDLDHYEDNCIKHLGIKQPAGSR
jgi:hypothetical protein